MFKQQLIPVSCESSSDLPPIARLLCGSAAGLTSVLFTYPLDYVHSRITYQVKMTRYSGIVDTIRQTVQEAGVRGLYRGFGATAMGIIPYAGVSFLTYDTLKSLAASHYAQKQHSAAADSSATAAPASASAGVPVWVRLMCGAIAGASAQTASYPLDVVRRRMQLTGLASQVSHVDRCTNSEPMHATPLRAAGRVSLQLLAHCRCTSHVLITAASIFVLS